MHENMLLLLESMLPLLANIYWLLGEKVLVLASIQYTRERQV